MVLRIAVVAVLVMGSVDLSAQGRRGPRTDRYFDTFGLPADEWCREAERSNRYARSCDVREESLSGISSLDVDSGGNGGIRVRGIAGTATRVRFRVVGNASDDRDAREIVQQVRVTTDAGRIRVTGPRSRNDEWWNVEVEIEAPRDLPMTLTTSNGGIALEGTAGRARFDTQNGGVALRNVSGDVRGRTVNGGVSIALEGSQWQGAGLDVETTNGGVRMELPSNYNAELHTETNNGGIDIDFPVTVRGRLSDMRRRIDTTIGSGGAPLRVRTVNGGVSIARR
jgi:DUF4097 and DUF4098 domain-containing protein YvlB